VIDPKTKQWIPEKPDPMKIHKTMEPHARGAILVAAVFDAFITVYNWRIASLLRIATGGADALPAGELHPDLVDLLAKEAAKTAGHVLQICIRALDYCVPVDITFGDYLRALITADHDIVTDDRHNYRLAFIQAFRQRGIIPWGVRNMSEANLLWEEPENPGIFKGVFTVDFLDRFALDWKLISKNRADIFNKNNMNQALIHNIISQRPRVAEAFKIRLDTGVPRTFYGMDHDDIPHFQVFSARPARRIGPDGHTVTDLVVEIIQSRYGYFKPEDQEEADKGNTKKEPDFILRGGCTLLIDPQEARVRYCIYKRMDSDSRLKSQREYLTGEEGFSARATYFGDPRHVFYRNKIGEKTKKGESGYESFSFLHRSHDIEEVE
jgi:hypothetical protein